MPNALDAPSSDTQSEEADTLQYAALDFRKREKRRRKTEGEKSCMDKDIVYSGLKQTWSES